MGPPPVQQVGQSRSYVSKMGDGSGGYLVIEQATPTGDNVTVSALMDTNLRLLDVFNLICEDEPNPEFGSDDSYTTITVDGSTARAVQRGGGIRLRRAARREALGTVRGQGHSHFC
jgi:hypothetical protein